MPLTGVFTAVVAKPLAFACERASHAGLHPDVVDAFVEPGALLGVHPHPGIGRGATRGAAGTVGGVALRASGLQPGIDEPRIAQMRDRGLVRCRVEVAADDGERRARPRREEVGDLDAVALVGDGAGRAHRRAVVLVAGRVVAARREVRGEEVDRSLRRASAHPVRLPGHVGDVERALIDDRQHREHHRSVRHDAVGPRDRVVAVAPRRHLARSAAPRGVPRSPADRPGRDSPPARASRRRAAPGRAPGSCRSRADRTGRAAG